MNNPLQITPGGLLLVAGTEYDLPQSPSVDLPRRIKPRRVKYRVAKTLSNGVPHRFQRQNLVANVVSIDQQNVGVTRRHPAGHRTFSRTNPPDNSDNGNGRAV